MTFAVEPVMGGINTALNAGLSSMSGTSKILLGMIVGGMMSIDMGGPFNKARFSRLLRAACRTLFSDLR